MSDTLRVSNLYSSQVGIGTASPQATLHIVGPYAAGALPVLGAFTNSAFSVTHQSGTYGLNVIVARESGASHIQAQSFSGYGSSITFPLTLNSQGGNVGIGITNPSSVLTINNTGAYQTHHFIIRGQEFYASGNSSTGIALNIGVNRAGNKQLWIMDPDLAINTTNGCLRIIPGSNTTLNCVSTDGTTNLPLTISGSSISMSSCPVIMPYIVWHFNWSAVQGVGVVGSSSIVNSINNTNISGTYINTPSSGRFTVPHSGVYICTFDCATTSVSETKLLLRIDGTYYNPYATSIGTYAQATYTEIVYLTAGQVLDWYCSLGGLQACNAFTYGNGSGKGITFSLMR